MADNIDENYVAMVLHEVQKGKWRSNSHIFQNKGYVGKQRNWNNYSLLTLIFLFFSIIIVVISMISLIEKMKQQIVYFSNKIPMLICRKVP